jgi:hypothetical protein
LTGVSKAFSSIPSCISFFCPQKNSCETERIGTVVRKMYGVQYLNLNACRIENLSDHEKEILADAILQMSKLQHLSLPDICAVSIQNSNKTLFHSRCALY